MADDKGKVTTIVSGKADKGLVAEVQDRPQTAQPAAKPAAAPAVMPPAPERTLIARGTEFQGSMVSSCGVTLDGKLRGELRAPSLVLNATGAVDGDVEVEELTSCGSLAGRIRAKNVQLSGRVNDRTVICAETLEVKLAQPGTGMQVSFGECELKIGNAASGASAQAAAKPSPAPLKTPPKPNDRDRSGL